MSCQSTPRLCWGAIIAALVCLWAASPAAEPGPAAKSADGEVPLVDNAGELKRLQPQMPVWLDAKQKRVIFLGETCQAGYGLEFLVTLPDRGYESVIISTVKPSVVHTALLALGAQPGRPATFQPRFTPAAGAEVEIFVAWKDKAGKRQQARAQELIRDAKSKKSPAVNWVFGGSGFWVDDATGKRHYQAEGGDFIAVANVPIATLDLPLQSATALESRTFEANPERLPPKGTAVTVILAPKPATTP